jgi:sugar lactone lactonase YvrE
MNTIRTLVTSSLLMASFVLAQGALRYPDPAPERLVNSAVVATFPTGIFMEGIAVDRQGTLYATILGLGRAPDQLWTRTRTGVVNTINLSAQNLAVDPSGRVWASVSSGNPQDPQTLQFHLERLNADGTRTMGATFRKGASPNGITFDPAGNLYAADSALGILWRVKPGGVDPEVWLQDARFAPKGPQGIPGVNGIKVFERAVYTPNSSSGEFFRVSINADGGAGAVSLRATGVPGDSFAFDAAGNAFVTTHVFNTVVRVDTQGNKTVLGNVKNGIVGATDAAFGVGADRTGLYVVQDGGAFLDLVPPAFAKAFPQDRAAPAIVRLEVGNP